MSYYSHSEQQQGQRVGSKLLRRHVDGVTDKARQAYFRHHGFPEAEALAELVERVCQLHDLGKYTPHFQHYLLDNGPFEQLLKQHAKFGAYALYDWYRSEGREWLGLLACYVVVHHHKSLSDFAEFKQLVTEEAGNDSVFAQQLESLRPELATALQDGGMGQLEEFVRFPEKKPFQRLISQYLRETSGPQSPKWYFLLNYTFSLLIEADKLDASNTVPYVRKPLPALAVEQRLGVARWEPAADLSHLTQNELRSWVRGRVLSALDDPAIHAQRLFTLTAPTGIGKTLTALDFALRLREKIQEKEGHQPQIIYSLPFINIIEQAVAEYEATLGTKVLAHYQYADALEQLKHRRGADGQEENEAYNQKRMLVDTWQGDVVITSFVQLLQTLIGHRNKLLLKFHHFAGSIIILDEVQTLRLGQLPLVGAVLHFLAKYLNSRVLLMTATRPLTFELAYRIILKKEGEPEPAVQELLPEYTQVFATFRRTQLVSLLHTPLADEQEFLESVFSRYWQPERSGLVVCNLVRRSVRVFEVIRDYVADEQLDTPLYYLSTNVVPVSRLQVIQQIKADLRAGRKPVLVATQVVEAGVDLDFDMGFRDLGPVDSLVQVAGRINRENDPKRALSPLYVMDFGDCHKIYDAITTQQARRALDELSEQGQRPIPEPEYLDLVGRYFAATAEVSGFEEAKKIFASIKALNYDNRDDDQKPISAFRIIEDNGMSRSVFIELDERATEVKAQFQLLLRNRISQGEFERFKRDFNQRIISVPSYLPRMQALEQGGNHNQLCEGLYLVNHDELSDYYHPVTGFRRDAEPENQHIAL
ncbi:CRISPR-associated helicase/endonuclease Cas3 [Hymenobacter fastidiosus]|uniref:CRISPR-associated helicase/endonuclease Cas3 n=1 Tax=Hymenobacter fastidiosus TaxID=486264 RepID=A0ABP7RT99_9BACT